LTPLKVISAEDAARVLMDGDTVATSGFVGVGSPALLSNVGGIRVEE
jgi:acyl CoA:acetate/3-ketoacid CoA transferase alpha subunit